jgi:hypothetical protein
MTTRTITYGVTEEELVLAWRVEELIRAGYDLNTANALAKRSYVDLHEATGLVRRGCPPRTAARILL